MGNRGHLVVDLGWKSPEEMHKMMIKQERYFDRLQKEGDLYLKKAIKPLKIDMTIQNMP